jgi:chromosome segregation ATPase
MPNPNFEQQISDIAEALVNVENATKRLLGDLETFKGEIAATRAQRDHAKQELDAVRAELASPELQKAKNDLLIQIAKEQSDQTAKLDELKHNVIAAHAELEKVQEETRQKKDHHDRIEQSIVALRHRLTR